MINKDTNKLYLVKLRTYRRKYSESYVVAKNTDAAYKKIRKFLDDNDLCFSSERELESIILLAEDTQYPDCEKVLFL